MAQTKQSSLNNNSSSYGEGAVRQANVLASCYVIDNSATQLKGFHYCTTLLTGLPSPPSSPPLAALSATNELTVLPKKRSANSNRGASNNRPNRRGGATLRIREECERLFCETMKTVFLGERNTATHGSGLTGVYGKTANGHRGIANGQLLTPPAETGFTFNRAPSHGSASSDDEDDVAVGGVDPGFAYSVPTAWLELWDFAGCASFRGFLAEDVTGALSLFAFFDAHLLSRDLKQALMALIELAESALGCAHLVICVDRRAALSGDKDADKDAAASLMKGLQWAGFSLTTLDTWTGGEGVDVTSPAWVFMGMEL